MGVASAHTIYFGTREHYTIRITRKVNDTKIDTQEIIGLVQWALRHFTSNVEIPLATPKGQVDFSFTEMESTPLKVAHAERDFDPAFQGPERYNLLANEPQKSTVVRLGRQRPESPQGFSVAGSVCVGHFRDTPYNRLRTEAVVLFDLMVDVLLDPSLVVLLVRVDPGRDAVAGTITRFQRRFQERGLFRGRIELDNQDVLHYNQSTRS